MSEERGVEVVTFFNSEGFPTRYKFYLNSNFIKEFTEDEVSEIGRKLKGDGIAWDLGFENICERIKSGEITA